MKRSRSAFLGGGLARSALGLAIAGLAIGTELALWSSLPPTPFLLVYPAVVLAAWLGGRAAGVTAIVASAIALAYWFLPPTPSLAIAAWRDAFDLAIFCTVSILLVELVARTRRALHDAHAATRAAEAATAARDTVLAVVAHDLRNPLQTIGLSAELLLAEVAAYDERAEPKVVRIRRAAERARRLVDNILDSARIDVTPFPVEPSVWSLSSLVDESLSPFKPLADARFIELDLPSPDALGGSIVCDHDRIVQVLSNIVGNALQFTPRGGKVVVDVRHRPQEVRFEVTDTGSGMTNEELAHAFERLWHGRGPGHGSGLGLWIAKALVEAHGGSIEAASEPGRGTRITFVLPQPSPEAITRDAGGAQLQQRAHP